MRIELLLTCKNFKCSGIIQDFTKTNWTLGEKQKVYINKDDDWYIFLYRDDLYQKIIGQIIAQNYSKDNATVILDIEDDRNWPEIEFIWSRLINEIKRQGLIESLIDSRNVQKSSIFEMELKTDIDAFISELIHFAQSFPRSGSLLDVSIVEFTGGGLFNVRPIDNSGAILSDRIWSVTLNLRRTLHHVPYRIDGALLRLSYIGGEFPLLLRIPPCAEEALPFIRAFVDRCKQLWDCQIVNNTLDQSLDAAIYKEAKVKQPSHSTVRPFKPGSPGLDKEELFNRLSKAQEAEDLRIKYPDKYWKNIAVEVNWHLGNGKNGMKLLEQARRRLKRLKENDPDNILGQLNAWKRKKK